MSEQEKERFVIEHEGEEHLFEELFRFTVDDTGKSYMALIPVEQKNDEKGEEVEVFAFRFEENEGNHVSFYPIETEAEWEMVEEMLGTVQDEWFDDFQPDH